MDTEIVIVGLGPAGLQAAIHAARKKAKVIVVGRSEASALNRAEIENYFGHIGKMGGEELLRVGREQAQHFGAELLEEDVLSMRREGEVFITNTDHDREIRSKVIILATGISRTKLNVPGEKEFLGKGVSYCASCDGGFFRGRAVAVIGDESEAAESAMLLSELASKVYWVSQKLKVSDQLLDKIKKTSVEMLTGKPTKIAGEVTVTSLELDAEKKLDVQGVFIALGAKGSMELALELGLLPDPSGRINVDADMKTEMDHVYACGDVTGTPWQLARAVGQGCIAGDIAAKLIRQERA
jgi:thioredoxin reductase (NADPH)